MAGALHRGWAAMKMALSTMDEKAVLQTCERGCNRLITGNPWSCG